MLRTLYISYTGLMEPLGYSQIYSYLKNFNGCTIHLITVEKSESLKDHDKLLFHKKLCEDCGIKWTYLQYSNRWRFFASISTILKILIIAILDGEKDIIHARAYVAGVAAYIYKLIKGTKFVFDMRALWVDELVSIGSIKKNSILAKVLYNIEEKLINNADSVISLTRSAVDYLVLKYEIKDVDKFSVIPTCVDLSRFDSDVNVYTIDDDSQIIFGSVGGILSGWYSIEYLLKIAHIISSNKRYILKIITKDDPATVLKLLNCVPPDQLVVMSCEPADMPNAMADIDIGILFFKPVIGKLGSAPTRLAEYFAMGIPVITNSGVGDMSMLVQDNKLGYVFNDQSDLSQSFNFAINFIRNDSDISHRCKVVCKSVFSLDHGVANYMKIYSKLA